MVEWFLVFAIWLSLNVAFVIWREFVAYVRSR
jgi:hypothetical protein